jgi:hypothetical protein
MIERQREIYIACELVHIHFVSTGIIWPRQEANMHPKANYSDDLAAAAEQVFSQPIRIVNVLPMDFSNHQN